MVREPGPDSTREERIAYREYVQRRTEIERINRRRRVLRRSVRRPFLGVARWTLGLLPPAPAAALGHALGAAAFHASRKLRKRVLTNLDLAYGDTLSGAEKRAIGRGSLAYAGRGALSLVSLARRGPARALARVRAEGVEHLEAALAKGKGCIIVSFHYGLFDLLASWTTQRYGNVAVGREAPEGSPTAILQDLRARLGARVIERGDFKGLLRVLRENRPLGLVADHDVSDVKGCFVPFFGRLAHTPNGPAALSLRTGAPLVVGLIEWEGLARHRIRFEAVEPPDADLPREQALLDLTHRFTQVGEHHVRRRPDQWLWMHKRWETRPEHHPEWPVWRGSD